MIECVITMDCEIYGNGEGSLKELIYEPTEKLMSLFLKFRKRFVSFIEVAEVEMIEAAGTDPAIDLVKRQIWDLHREGFELGLHLHPQWYKARHVNGSWVIDYSEYNLCTLPRERIARIVNRAVMYFRKVLEYDDFTPLSFRAGNWLFQPTQPVASVLAEAGIKLDSSVFKGGLQRQHNLDYRPALENGYYWRFGENVNVPDSGGALIEMPIYTQMVPFWKMLTAKRVGLQQKSAPAVRMDSSGLSGLQDRLRFMYPLKFDFCRMTIGELTRMVDRVVREDRLDPKPIRPIVVIGHSKDLIDIETVESFLQYLEDRGIRVSTFRDVYQRIR